jgi:hypothetical protein
MEVSSMALPSLHRFTELAIPGILTERWGQRHPELEKNNANVRLSPESIANVRNT